METVSKKRGRPRIHDLDHLPWAGSANLGRRAIIERRLATLAMMALCDDKGEWLENFDWFKRKGNGGNDLHLSVLSVLARVCPDTSRDPNTPEAFRVKTGVGGSELIRIYAREVVRLGKSGVRDHELIRRIRYWRRTFRLPSPDT
jgi:hypothetical protein